MAKRWLFTSAVQDTNVIVGLKLLTKYWDKRDNDVLCTGKEITSGLKLARMETDVATRTCKLLSRKEPEYCDINIVLLQISAKWRSVPKVCLFHLEAGLA